jgi:hypothetical protein
MDAPLKQAWIDRCAKRLTELQPLLRPSVAGLVAQDLWQDERGHIPPEEWAELEVTSWGRQSRLGPSRAQAQGAGLNMSDSVSTGMGSHALLTSFHNV